MKNVLAVLSIMASLTLAASTRDINLRIIHTTDVHGNFFPYDYINRTDGSGSLARVYSYIKEVRDSVGDENVILLDAGDILQGQPTVYYYNFIDTVSPHVAARVYNYMGYDVVTIGNHDIETGHAVYDRFRDELKMPVLGANVIDSLNGRSYFEPYRIIEKGGVKIAVVGLLTPAVPAWLPETLWSGLEFKAMEGCAAKMVEHLRQTERPDVIIGLFHSGNDASRRTGDFIENASYNVARNVPGFDIILTGHDHTRFNRVTTSADGKPVVVMNPANNAEAVSDVSVSVTLRDGKVVDKKISGRIVNVDALTPDEGFMAEFAMDCERVKTFVDRVVGRSDGEFSTHDSYFGPSAFIDLLNDLQLAITGADISFAAPLAFDAVIKEGDIRMSDMFNLYKYENLLYTMELTGREIKDYLEESYGIWTRQMSAGDEHILLFADENPTVGNSRLKNAAYNFDAAAGIVYTVDVTRPHGEKINIVSMADGTAFDMGKTYRVAVNSYRGNGGGDLLTRGAGIDREDLKKRVVRATDKDLRYYLMKEIERSGVITPKVNGNWRFVPDDIVTPAIANDRKILFSKDN